jgi:hypothetical protein
MSAEIREMLLAKLEAWDNLPVVGEISAVTLDELFGAADGIYGQQMHVLKGVVNVYKKFCRPDANIPLLKKEFWTAKEKIARGWLAKYPIKRIGKEQYLASNIKPF